MKFCLSPSWGCWFSLPIVTAGLLGCNAPRPEEVEPVASPESGPSTSSGPTAAPGPAADPELAPGQYCYGIETEDLSGVARLRVQSEGQVNGDSQVTIHQEEASYYSSYIQQLTGQLQGNQLTAAVTTWIEYDVQEDEVTWSVTPTNLTTDQGTFTELDCAVAREPFLGPNGLEAADLLDGATAIHSQRVQFEPGTTAAEVQQSVIRGERDLYLVNAQGGQQMQLELTSLENNAAFDVVAPSGLILARESTAETLFLPHTGDYQVIVAGTRGNASYRLRVEIPEAL